MRKIALILTIGFIAYSCDKPQTEDTTVQETSAEVVDTTETEETVTAAVPTQMTPRGTIYRSDGFRPGVVSEWVQVAYNDDMTEIVGIWKWDVKNEEKVQMEILDQEVISGEEISGAVGEFRYPGSDFTDGFGIVDEIFAITGSDGNRQEFDYEGFEE